MSEQNPTKARLTKGAIVAGGLALAQVNPIAGYLLAGAAEMTGPGPGGIDSTISNFRDWVVNKTGRNLGQRITDENVDPDPERISFLFANSIPLFNDVRTEEKRQMMEDILLNGAKKSREAATQIEARTALREISLMTDASVLIFANVLALIKNDLDAIVTEECFDIGIPKFLIEKSLDGLRGSVHDYAYKNENGEYIESSLEFKDPFDEDGNSMKSKNAYKHIFVRLNGDLQQYKLTEYGKWLSGWVIANQLPER